MKKYIVKFLMDKRWRNYIDESTTSCSSRKTMVFDSEEEAINSFLNDCRWAKYADDYKVVEK